MARKALVVSWGVTQDEHGIARAQLQELNGLLSDGWSVVLAAPMGGGVAASTNEYNSYTCSAVACLVVLEKSAAKS